MPACVALAGRLPCTCPPLPINKVHLPAIAICAVIAVARRARRWQAGATHELPGGWQAGAGIQAVYCDRRWQAGRVVDCLNYLRLDYLTPGPYRDYTLLSLAHTDIAGLDRNIFIAEIFQE